jgi:hypothetical protein
MYCVPPIDPHRLFRIKTSEKDAGEGAGTCGGTFAQHTRRVPPNPDLGDTVPSPIGEAGRGLKEGRPFQDRVEYLNAARNNYTQRL